MNKTKTILPYNSFAEQIVLGSILTNPDSINFVSQVLPIEAFYLPNHQYIYKAALILNMNQQIVDLITVSTWLQDNGLIEQIGGLSTLNNLIEKIVSFINLPEYTSLIQDKYIRRLLINLGDEIITLGYQTNFPLEKIFNKIEKKLFKLNQKKISKNLNTTAEILTEILIELKKKSKISSFSGYSSRFYDLNAMTQGFQKSDLIIIAGRPAMGKTAFSLIIAHDITTKYNVPVIFFSLEMTKQQLVYRLLAVETEIATTRLKLGKLDDKEWLKINKSVNVLSSLPLHIDDTPNISLTEIHFKVQKIKLQYGCIGAIIIDYLQLLESIKKTENRVQEISQITRSLKGIAREFNIPVIVLSQLSRNVESRNNKRPVLSDLRESGCVNITKLNWFKLRNKNYISKIPIYSPSQHYLKKTPFFTLKFTGKKPVYIIEINLKLSINTTSNHKLFSNYIWKRIDQLNQVGKLKFNLSSRFKNKRFKSFINCNLKKIKYIGYNNVYDFKVNKFKNFLSNGFILHNSIEQDADIVLMLYRNDYYYEQTDDKNTAEVIIAKHRNGPVGSIKLGFDGCLTKFFNYP